jgi:hypothetical protein
MTKRTLVVLVIILAALLLLPALCPSIIPIEAPTVLADPGGVKGGPNG